MCAYLAWYTVECHYNTVQVKYKSKFESFVRKINCATTAPHCIAVNSCHTHNQQTGSWPWSRCTSSVQCGLLCGAEGGERAVWRGWRDVAGCQSPQWRTTRDQRTCGSGSRSEQRRTKLTIFSLTHWGREKMIASSQTTLLNEFSWMKMLNSDLNFTEICSEEFNWPWGSIGLGNGLALNSSLTHICGTWGRWVEHIVVWWHHGPYGIVGHGQHLFS